MANAENALLLEPLVLRTAPSAVFTVLAPYEKKGYEVTGLKTRGGGALIALRASPEAVAAGRLMALKLKATLPPSTPLVASASVSEALEWLHGDLGAGVAGGCAATTQVSKEVVQWAPEEEESWVHADGPLLGSHDDHRERFTLADLIAPDAVGTAAGEAFCHQLRRDSYVPILVPPEVKRSFLAVEGSAAEWFNLDEDEKNEQGGAYGHIDRKFTGYRNGKYREQLEVRQTLDTGSSGLYPLPSTPDQFGDELRTLINFLDSTARSLLRHIAVDVGADDGFFEGLLDPPPPAAASPPTKKTAAKKGKENNNGGAQVEAKVDAANGTEANGEAAKPPVLGHSLIRLCKYDPNDEGVYGSNVLCEAHNDVGFITLDACASIAGLETLRRADGMWVPVEEAKKPEDGTLVLVAMVGDTLGRLTNNYYAPCKHRVVQPPAGIERIGLPFLFRGRSDAVLNTKPTRDACAKAGKVAHLAELETTMIKELPAFDSARAILRGWKRN